MLVRRPESHLGTAPSVAAYSRQLRRRAWYLRRRRVATALRRVGGVLTLLCALFGLPAALVTIGQVCWSELDVAEAVAQPLSAPVLLLTVVVIGWLLWAWLVVATVLDVAAVLTRGVRTVRLLPAPVQTTVTTLAGSLLMAITSVTAGASAVGAAPPAGTAAHSSGPPTTQMVPAPTVDAATAVPDLTLASADTTAPRLSPGNGPRSGAWQTTHATQGQPLTVTVWRGDTLWSISERCLGDPHRWREIYRRNADRYDRDGRMHGGHHIEPTWTLALPDDAQPCTSTGHTEPSGRSVTAPPAAQAQPDTAEPSPTTTAQSRDDGVTGQHPSDVPSVSVTVTTAKPAAGQPGSPGQTDSGGRGGRTGVELFTGSWVDAGLAGAITAAVALVWAHRRRRYVPRTPAASTRLDDTDITAMPAVVRKLRRATGTSTTHTPTDTSTVGAATDDHTADSRREDGSGDAAALDADAHHDATPVQSWRASAAEPTRSGQGWRRSAGLGLIGPGAEAAARGLLVAAVADGPDDPADRSVVLIPTPTAVRLFGTGHALPDTPRIVITKGLPEAVERLEAVTLHRSRVLQQHTVDTVAEVRRTDPLEEPLPPTILLTDTDTLEEHRGRIIALLQQGHRLDVHGVLLGPWPPGDTITVTTDGSTGQTSHRNDAPTGTPAEGRTRNTVDVGRLTVLTAAEAVDLLNVLAESHTGQPPTAVDDLAAPDEPADPDAGTTRPVTAIPEPPKPGPAADTATPRSTDTDGQAAGPTEPGRDAAAEAAAEAGGTGGQAGGGVTGDPIRRVAVELLGTPRVVDADTSKGTLRAKSLELLAYLAVHDGPVHYEAILDDLLPDAPANKAVHRLHTYISDLRRTLRRTGGDATYITRTGQRYLLNRDAFDVDLWRMRTALDEAEHADDPASRTAAWQQALHEYRAHVADGVDYEWIEPHREAARRQAVDAALALADALKDRPAEVIPILDTAIRHSPYTEALYQAAMRANAAAGRFDTVRALRHDLTRQLADLDLEPNEETTALANHLRTVTPDTARRTLRRHETGAPAIPSTAHRPAPRAGKATGHAPDPATPPRPAHDTDTAA